MQIPVMARPRRSSSIPLCNFGEGCGAKHTASPPATYAVQCFPVRHARADSRWGGRVGRVNACPSVCSLCGRGTICPENPATVRPVARRVPTGHLASEAATSRSDSVRAPVLRVPARQPECVAGIVCVPFCVIPLRRSRRFVARNRPVPAAAAFAIELPAHSRGISRILGRFRTDYCDGPRTRILLHPIVQIKRGLWRDLHPDLPGRTLPIATPPASSTAHPSRLAVEGWRSRI